MKITGTLGSISYFPFVKDAISYRRHFFQEDIKAALIVALVALPQSITYSLIADLPPSVGVFSVIFGILFSGLWSSSVHLIAGSTNAMAIILQTGIAEILFRHFRGVDEATREILAINLTIQFTFFTGILQILASVLKLGRLTQYVSRTVIVGYVTGVALVVIVNQIYYFAGLPQNTTPSPMYSKFWFIISNFTCLHFPTLLLGTVCLVILLLIKKLKLSCPGGLLIIICGSVVVWLLGLSPENSPLFFYEGGQELVGKVALIRDTGVLPGIWPKLFWPLFDWTVVNDMLPIAFALAILGTMEAHAITQSVAAYSGQRLVVNQNIWAMGIGNVLSSFFGAMPSSGSPSRTMLNFQSGAVTRFASVFCALIIAGVIGVFGGFVKLIPLATLSALLLFTAYRMIDWKLVKICFKSTFEDGIVLFVTILSCIIFSLDTAFYIGVILAIIFYLKKSSEPQFIEYSFDEELRLQTVQEEGDLINEPIRMVGIEGEFFFGSVEVFHNMLRSVAEEGGVKVIILNLHTVRHLDATASLMLSHFNHFLKRKGCELLLSNICIPVWKVMRRSNLVSELGEKRCFLMDTRYPNLSLRQARVYAKTLIKEEDS
jgi:sulfate permease, SulP family